MTKPKNETPKDAEVPQNPAEPKNETPKTHGPEDYVQKALELLQARNDGSRDCTVAMNALKEAQMFIARLKKEV